MPRKLPAPAQPDPVLAAIETHRVAFSELLAEAAYFNQKPGSGRRREEFKAARETYEHHTRDLASAPIATLSGLGAFLAYLAGLQAYGRSEIAPGVYAVEVWDLSDAMSTASAALNRLHPPRPRVGGRRGAGDACHVVH